MAEALILDIVLVLVVGLVLCTASWWALRRPRLAHAAVLAGGVGVVTLICTWQLAKVRVATFGPTLLSVDTIRPELALTFDDGPTSAHTHELLELLAAAGARATFFVTGRELAEHPELGRAIHERGHELGNHSWSHSRMIFARQSWLRAEIERTDALIREAGQQQPISFRPPYGKRLLALHVALGDRMLVLWDVEPESDPSIAGSPRALTAHVLKHARPGSIVLLHAMNEARESTRRALPTILSGLHARGLRPVTLSELLRGEREDRVGLRNRTLGAVSARGSASAVQSREP